MHERVDPGNPIGTAREGRLTRPDGRTVAWTETGVPDGRPVLRLPGTPGSRLWLRSDQAPWHQRHLRMITTERPGFGASTAHRGRTILDHADDLVAILDELGIERAPVLGISGAAPFVLGMAARHPDRVAAASVLVGAAPIDEQETRLLVGLNAESNRLAKADDRDGMVRLLTPVRESLLADPLASFREVMRTAPPLDQEIMCDPGWQQMLAQGLTEALRGGVEGWVDESVLMVQGWSELHGATMSATLTWWHGDHDRNSPLSAVQRLLAPLPRARLVVWPDAGHLTPYRHEGQILDELLVRS